jgi:hypothetical protein
MALYRCFLMDSTNHIYGSPEIIEADGDGAAVDQAQRLCDRNPGFANVELWCGERHVRRLDRAI